VARERQLARIVAQCPAPQLGACSALRPRLLRHVPQLCGAEAHPHPPSRFRSRWFSAGGGAHPCRRLAPCDTYTCSPSTCAARCVRRCLIVEQAEPRSVLTTSAVCFFPHHEQQGLHCAAQARRVCQLRRWLARPSCCCLAQLRPFRASRPQRLDRVSNAPHGPAVCLCALHPYAPPLPLVRLPSRVWRRPEH